MKLFFLTTQVATQHVEQLEAEGETNINGALLQALKIVSETQVLVVVIQDHDGIYLSFPLHYDTKNNTKLD